MRTAPGLPGIQEAVFFTTWELVPKENTKSELNLVPIILQTYVHKIAGKNARPLHGSEGILLCETKISDYESLLKMSP